MRSAKKQLERAQKKSRELPDSWFGEKRASIEDLPTVKQKVERVRKNIFIDAKTVEYLEDESEKYGVPFTGLVNDILLMFVEQNKKKKKKKAR